MLSIPPSVKIFLCTEPTDLRRGFDGLATLVEQRLSENPLSGHLFIFLNRRCNRLKLLYWDEDGYAIWMKRLEQGHFQTPTSDHQAMQLDSTTLTLILDGIDLNSVQKRKIFQLKKIKNSSQNQGAF